MDGLPLIISRFLNYVPAITGGFLALYLYRIYKAKKESQ